MILVDRRTKTDIWMGSEQN